MMKGAFLWINGTQNGSTNGEELCVSTALPQNPTVAMAYVPFQLFGSTYEPEQALSNGTLFPELNKPFYGRKGEPR